MFVNIYTVESFQLCVGRDRPEALFCGSYLADGMLEYFLIFPRKRENISRENRIGHFLGDNFHQMSNPIIWEKIENINLSSAELAQKKRRTFGEYLL